MKNSRYQFKPLEAPLTRFSPSDVYFLMQGLKRLYRFVFELKRYSQQQRMKRGWCSRCRSKVQIAPLILYTSFTLAKVHSAPLAHNPFTLPKGQIDTLPRSLQNECAAMPIFQGGIGVHAPQTMPFSVRCLNHSPLLRVSFSGERVLDAASLFFL